jgi:hypothetical protein
MSGGLSWPYVSQHLSQDRSANSANLRTTTVSSHPASEGRIMGTWASAIGRVGHILGQSRRTATYAALSLVAAAVVVPLSGSAQATADHFTRLDLKVNGSRVYVTPESEVTISGDGRYVAATVSLQAPEVQDLSVPNPYGGPSTNYSPYFPAAWHTTPLQVVLYDRISGVTQLVTRAVTAPAGTYGDPAARSAWSLSLSRNGRYLVFNTPQDLAPGDVNKQPDTYLFDRVSGRFSTVVHDSSGRTFAHGTGSAGPAAISADGSTIVFQSDDPLIPGAQGNANYLAYFVRRGTSRYRYVFSRDAGNINTDASYRPIRVSANGRYIGFVCRCDANGEPHSLTREDEKYVLRRDVRAPWPTFVGMDTPSGGGYYTSGEMDMDAAANVFVLTTRDGYVLRNLATGHDSRLPAVPADANGKTMPAPPIISGDGRIAVAVLTNAFRVGTEPEVSSNELYRYDSVSGTVQRIPMAPLATACQDTLYDPRKEICHQGVLQQPSLSYSGDVIAFTTYDRLDGTDTDSFADVYLAT